MKQLYCPHRVTISGIQQYCINGKFPVDCYKCDCPEKEEIEVNITTSSTSDYTPIQKKLMEISKPRSEEAIKRAEERKEKRKERYKQGYHDAIEKACEWLKDNIDFDYYAYNKDFVTKEDFIKSFRKAMEDSYE